MRIRTFCKNVDVSELQGHNLKNCTVIIDGQNYFYKFYQKFGLPYVFGCEGDKYAECLRKHLAMFKDANVKCYILFKGGHEDKEKAINLEKRARGKEFVLNEPREDIVLPVFMKKIYKDVLKELNIDFVVCQFESKQQCIALAQKLKCPIISFDIEFCFSGVPYIPQSTLQYNSLKNCIDCRIFHYERFKGKYNLTDEKMAIFIALTDEKTFPEGTFDKMFRDLKLPLSFFKRNERLLLWLSKVRPQDAYIRVNKLLKPQEQKQFTEEMERITKFICRVETPGVPVEYLLNSNEIAVEENDPKWFEKGVALGYIDIIYVNLYKSGLAFASWSIEDTDADNAMLLSFDIIAYAYNLMTNYERSKLTFYKIDGEVEDKDVSLSNPATICKPSYVAQSSPFESGWERVKHLQLFQHFMTQALQGLDFETISSVPDDAKLLVLALVYFSRRKAEQTTREVYCILLSYVMLAVAFGKEDEVNNNEKIEKKPIIDATTDKNSVTEADGKVAKGILKTYFTLKDSELHSIFDRRLMHAFVEFQHCLDNLNSLNRLCGMPFTPTLFHKTYNGTFVYKFFYSMKDLSRDKALSYIEEMLSPAPTVLAFLSGLIKVYEEVMYR